MGFLNGQILAHTYLASLQYHNYENLESDILKIIISLIGRTIQFSRLICLSSQISFEEDFDGDTLGFPLDPDGLTDERIERSMVQLINGVEQAMASRDVIASFAEVDASLLSNPDLVKPLLSRMKLVQALYHIWKLLHQEEYSKALECLPNTKHLVQQVIDTKHLGSNMESHFDELYLITCFPQSPSIRKSLSIDLGLERLGNILKQLEIIIEQSFGLDCSNFIFLLNSFSYYYPDADCFVRGIMFFVFQSCNRINGKDAIIKAIELEGSAGRESYLDVDLPDVTRRYLDSIQESLSSLVQATIKTYSVSRPRQRRHLFHLILSWEELERSIKNCESELEKMIPQKVIHTSKIRITWI